MKRINRYIPTDNKAEVKNMAKDKPRDTSLDEWTCESDPHMMIVLNKFQVMKQFYEEVCDRFDVIRIYLIDDVEYQAADLVWGDLFEEFDPAKRPEIVLCLKHMAAQPKSCLREVRWGVFKRK